MIKPFKNFTITPEILNDIAELDEFKGSWKALGQIAPERLTKLRQIATIESVASSTRIEGVKLTDQEVEALLNGLDIYSFRSRDEEEVAGYAEAMDILFESWQSIPITENYIKQLHSVLLQYSSKDESHRGQYKKLSNNVEAFDADGQSLGILFETTSPFETPFKMESLLSWFKQELEEKRMHPLLVIGAFITRFLAIHPFQDGNGRISRVLTTLLLMKAGYEYVPFSSLERVIEENKDNYYKCLRASQSTIDKDESRLEEWISFFLKALLEQKNALAKKIQREHLLKSNLPELSMKILEVTKEHGQTTVKELTQLTGGNRNTIKAHLKRLVSEKHLKKHGQGKGSYYTL